ncbi:MAG TPA: c-type cytochrome [Xanthobacteraceae bacterium]|jgi:mono/diheme cytochrome c family protein|nr:c-type cytochrome [Xanthobacteraceae bacterium]
MRIGRSSGSWSVAGALAMLLLAAALAAATGAAADDFAYGRRLYLDKAQCSYCHGWAADGAGEPQSNGGAANLRQSFLNREQLIEVIMCGRPGTPMPHYDEAAYTDKRCYGMTEAELGTSVPALPPGSTLQKREVEAIADYLLAKFIGRGAVTHEECEEVFGTGGRACGQYPAKP